MTARRFLLCSTPAQGHTAPCWPWRAAWSTTATTWRFFTTEHYRDRVTPPVRPHPFAADYDAHDLMVANPEREASAPGRAGRQGRSATDLRRAPPGQYAGLMGILSRFPADVIVVDTMFFGALPLALGPRADRPALATIGVMPLAVGSRDTAPFGVALQPGHGRRSLACATGP